MATLKEYVDADFNYALSVHAPIMLRTDSTQLEIIARVHLDFNSNTKYVSYFIPVCTDLLQYCLALITNLNTALSITDSVAVQSKLPGEALMSSEDLKFSGRVFIYAESELTDEEQALLKERTQQVGLLFSLEVQSLQRSVLQSRSLLLSFPMIPKIKKR